MNTYLQEMKNALTGYYNAARACEGKAQEARQIYQQDVASGVIEKLYAQLEYKKGEAIGTINEVREKAIEAANRWGVLDGGKINDGDMKLLKFDISPDQFETIVNRNKNNGTMCFILNQYVQKHDRDEADPTEFHLCGRLSRVVIPTVEGKINAYNSFADSAISYIHNMSGNDWEFGVNSPITQSAVERFGEPNGVNDELLEMIE